MILNQILLLLAAQAPAAPAGPTPLPAEVHTFKDWAVACDNGMRCEAVSLVPEPPSAAENQAQTGEHGEEDPWERFGVMKLERGPEADAPLIVTISDFEGTPARLVKFEEVLGARISAGGEGVWRVEPADARAFVQYLYSGSLAVQNAGGQTISEVALDGAWGALLYMDERQGRLRTPTAILRPGRRPATIPAPPALPLVRVAPPTTERPLAIPAARLAQARRQHQCGAEEQGGEETQELAALGNGRTLVMMSCGAGAYNFSVAPLVAWREGNAIRIEPAPFDAERDEPDQPDTPAHFLVTNAAFDPETMTISEYPKGRGLGDCGSTASYAWDGAMFRLTERHDMPECRGTTEYLTTWRTRIERR